MNTKASVSTGKTKVTARLVGWLFAVTVGTGLLFQIGHRVEASSDQLMQFHQELTRRYPQVAHVSTDALADFAPDSIMLFDVREPDEYRVSHLRSAVRVSPDISAGEFLDQFAAQLSGKKAVFYCSVGERSSRLAQAVLQSDTAAELDVVNLAGGIFKWHNESRELQNRNGSTETVHPFNRFWGRLLTRDDKHHQY